MNRRHFILSITGAGLVLPFITQSQINRRESSFSIITYHKPWDTGEDFASRLVSEIVRSRREFPKHDRIVSYVSSQDMPFMEWEIADRFGTTPSWLRLIVRANN
jgi:NADPH-dependent curcumin reductase CurA